MCIKSILIKHSLTNRYIETNKIIFDLLKTQTLLTKITNTMNKHINENVLYGKVADHYIENGYTYHVMKPEIKIYNLDTAKQFLSERLALTKGKTYPLVFNCRNIEIFSMEAQRFESTDEGLEGVSLLTGIVKTKIQKILGNLFILLQKPKVPLKMFDNKEDCIKWIEKQKLKATA